MKRALVKRWNALGDVLLTTPIVKRFHAEGYEVDVHTLFLDIFENNPYVRKAFTGLLKGRYYHKVVELNLAYEKNPKMHIIDAYSMTAFGDKNTEHKCELFFKDKLSSGVDRRIPLGDFIVVHMGVGWENRTFSKDFWEPILLKTDYDIVCVGGRGDLKPSPEFPGVLDLVGHLSIHELAQVIARARLFIGPDSGPLHIAQTTSTPCIGLYTCAKAEYRVHGNCHPIGPLSREEDVIKEPFRSDKNPAILECYGCLHDEPPPVCYVGCRRGDFICVKERITPEMVLKKVEEVLG